MIPDQANLGLCRVNFQFPALNSLQLFQAMGLTNIAGLAVGLNENIIGSVEDFGNKRTLCHLSDSERIAVELGNTERFDERV
jgi:hypothetical protein